MYFIRVSWKYIANVETEAEGGREGGGRAWCGGGAASPPQLHLTPLGSLPVCTTGGVGKRRGPFLCDLFSLRF